MIRVLKAHPDKTGYIVVKGNKKDVITIEKELKMNSTRFNKFPMKGENEGQILEPDHPRTGWRPVQQQQLRTERASLNKKVFKIRSIVEEFLMQCWWPSIACLTPFFSQQFFCCCEYLVFQGVFQKSDVKNKEEALLSTTYPDTLCNMCRYVQCFRLQ